MSRFFLNIRLSIILKQWYQCSLSGSNSRLTSKLSITLLCFVVLFIEKKFSDVVHTCSLHKDAKLWHQSPGRRQVLILRMRVPTDPFLFYSTIYRHATCLCNDLKIHINPNKIIAKNHLTTSDFV